MTDLLPIPRFPLPDNWSPEGVVCVRITIPDDQQYLGQLIGLLDGLAWSTAFERDPTKTGAATVARTWKAALESQPVLIEGCDMPDTRINPETCLFEVNCGTNDDPDWRPVFTPDYDPSSDAPVVPTYPDAPAEGQTNQCLAAANASAYLQWNAGQFSSSLGSIGFVGVLIGLLYTWLSAVVNVTIGALYDTIGSSFTAFNAGTIEDDFEAMDWQEVTDILVCEYDENGVMDTEGWENVHDAFQTKLDETGNQIWLWLRLVWNVIGTVGATVAGLWGGITDADCAACCDGDWLVVYDKDDSAWPDFENFYSNQDIIAAGSFVTGQGWSYSDFEISSGGYNRVLGIKLSQAGMVVRSVHIETSGNTNRCTICGLGKSIGRDTPDHSVYYGVSQGDDVPIGGIDWSGSEVANDLWIYLSIDCDGSAGSLAGSGYITRISICGDGTAPSGGTP